MKATMRLPGRPTGSGRTALAERLFARGVRTASGCLEYSSSRNAKGYGRIGLGGRKGRDVGAHVAAWMVEHGEVPEGLQVLHRCDNPPCFDIAHLFVGTPADNMRDKVEKGRARGCPGERHPRARLTAEQVVAIRAEYALGQVTTRALGDLFGVSGVCIHKIVTRKTWSHVA